MNSFDKINQITTLEHHGNKKMEHIRKQAQRAALQQKNNRTNVAPSTPTDFPLPPPPPATQGATFFHLTSRLFYESARWPKLLSLDTLLKT